MKIMNIGSLLLLSENGVLFQKFCMLAMGMP